MPEPRQAPRKGLLADLNGAGNGFVLLEVLLAMSLIVGVWMALVGTYQNLALRNAQEESKRAQLKKEAHAFEISEHVRASITVASKGLSHESSRVPSRNRAIPVASKPTSQKQRWFSDKANSVWKNPGTNFWGRSSVYINRARHTNGWLSKYFL